jgi:hypothetical protein
MNKITTTLFSIFLFNACEHHSAQVRLPDNEFFPLKSRTFFEFGVEKTRYNFDQPPQVSRYNLRKTLLDSILVENNLVYPVQYAVAKPFNESKIDSVNAAWITSDKAFEQENGKNLVRFYFPFSEGMRWNVNAFNNGGEFFGTLVEVNKPARIGLKQYPRTATIVYQDDSTLLARKKYIEIYAANVGLVYREKLYLQYCHEGNCLGKGVIESGWKEILNLEKSGTL